MFGCFQASLVLKGKSRSSNAIVFYKCHIPYRYIQIEFAAIVLGRGSEVVRRLNIFNYPNFSFLPKLYLKLVVVLASIGFLSNQGFPRVFP